MTPFAASQQGAFGPAAPDPTPASDPTLTPGSRPAGRYWWIGRRLVEGAVVVWLISLIVFIATQVLPGSPAKAIYGKNATPELIEALNRQFGLDRPLITQYLSWLRGILTGDLGTSIALRAPVDTILPGRLGNTVILVAVAFAIALPASFAVAMSTAKRRDRLVDRAVLGTSLVITALPDFVIGLLLVMLLGTTVLHLLPPVALFPPEDSPLAHPLELALPVLTLVLVIVPYLYRLLRASLIDALESDYVQMARLKGMPARIVLRRHALPNALVPVVQATGVLLGVVLAGTVVVEFIFRYPGLGSLLWNAVSGRDLQLIQAVVLVYAVAVVVSNLAADIVTVLVTPRLRTAGAR